MKALVLYHSYGGNTKTLAEFIAELLEEKGYEVDMLSTKDCIRSKRFNTILDYDVVMFGSNTWGDGILPAPMHKIFDAILIEENKDRLSKIVTGIFGTGETGYAHYCGAVTEMINKLKDITNLAVTLKIEQLYSRNDVERIEKFVTFADTRYMKYVESLHTNENQVG